MYGSLRLLVFLKNVAKGNFYFPWSLLNVTTVDSKLIFSPDLPLVLVASHVRLQMLPKQIIVYYFLRFIQITVDDMIG